GSTFWFTAAFEAGPAACANLTVLPSRSAAAQPAHSDVLTTPRILVAEDNVVNREVAVRILGQLGFRVDVVEDGQGAIDAARRSRYDAILMDCQMPEVDGFEATAAIRQFDGPASSTPIIALTASAMHGDRERCLAAGMDD